MAGPVRSVSHAFSILRLLVEHSVGQTLTDIARTSGLSPSSCLNLLRTLVFEGAIEIVSGKRYRLTADWAGCAGLLCRQHVTLIARAQPLMTAFARRHDATVGLWRSDRGDRLELIALGESESPTRIHMVIGQRQPIGAGSTGRALAASQAIDRQGLRKRFAGLRWRQPISFDEYAGEVAAAKDRGFAIDDGIAFAGVCSLACAMFVAASPYCLSVSTFAGVRDGASLAELGRALRELASAVAGNTESRSEGRR